MENLSRAPLIVAAMPGEMRHALEAVTVINEYQSRPWPWWEATLDGQPVYLLLSGIGMVNAGAALSRMLTERSPGCVFSFGCAGAHRPEMNPGDVVLGTRYVHHRAVTILPSGEEKFTGTPTLPENSAHFVAGFESDPELLISARHAMRGWSPERWPSMDPESAPVVYEGPVASADAWAQSTVLIEQIHAEHGTLCEDMEAAALAQIATMHGIPFLAIKDISNNEFQASTDLGITGWPSLESVMNEVGRRAFDLVRRVISEHLGRT